ncbi:hypothetical protein CLV36_106203 [Laceyella sediminis]|uniref:Uncharacterized protein n=1 Tax=Laceyella sediminis TaxID=573074 RepID=A0ABX5ER67_9BACL|nr:hypothetical protein [Laceyella sediminis]PRZ14439.1 hypothetical protein CLV36_106203 [Laceyella sediminis]
MKGRCWLFIYICLYILLSLPSLAYAEDAKQVEKAPTLEGLNNRIEDLEGHRELLKDLGEEVKNYRDHIQAEMTRFQETMQSERDSFFAMFQFLVGAQTALLAIGGYIVIYYIGQTKMDLRKQMELELDQTKKELNKEFQQQLREEKQMIEKQFHNELALAIKDYHNQLQQVRLQMEKQYKDTLEQVARETEQDYVALKKNIENEKTFTSSRIWVMGPEAEIKKMETEEVDLIRRRGIQHVQVKLFDRDQLHQALENNEFDILIYRYIMSADGSSDQDLITIAKMLMEKNDEIPFIVYGEEKIKKETLNTLNKYRYFSISNFRLSLIGNIFALAYAFNKQNRNRS